MFKAQLFIEWQLWLLHDDLQRVRAIQTNPCAGKNAGHCLQVLGDHYKEVGLEIKNNLHKLNWSGVEVVEKLATEMDMKRRNLIY